MFKNTKPNEHDNENKKRAIEYIKLIDQGRLNKEQLNFISMIVSNFDDPNFALTYKEYSRIQVMYELQKAGRYAN